MKYVNHRSSISDSGLGMICNVFPETLSKLLLALCPNITSSNNHTLHLWNFIFLIKYSSKHFLDHFMPSISLGGIQFAAAQLPRLELMDCGITICDPNYERSTDEDDDDSELQKTPNSKMHLIYQKLIIKHNRLKKLSLWGCSGLDVSLVKCIISVSCLLLFSCFMTWSWGIIMQALYLNCPKLDELNLNSCRNLHPGIYFIFEK